jgi:transcriptional regulator with XRE-family HTH domain
MDIGGELRAARQARSLTIDDIARATKISHRVLRAIESSTFEVIPRGPFMRGYLMAYATVVGLDGEELVRRFREEFAPALPPPEPTVQPAAEAFDPRDTSAGGWPSHILQIAVIVIIAAAYLMWQRQPPPAAGTPPPVSDVARGPVTPDSGAPHPAVTPAVAPADLERTVGTSGTSGTSAPAAHPLAIELRAQGPCWVQTTVDGVRGVGRLLNAGDHESLTVKESLVMRLGEPGAMAMAIDGAAARSLGRPGRPVTVRVDSTNYRQFLAP